MKPISAGDACLPQNDPGEVSSFLQTSSSLISFKKSGAGPPLIVFHGWLGDEDTFAPCHAAFAQYYTVYRPAWPGYGKSSPVSNFTIEDLVEIGRQFILATSDMPVTLIGNCLGGVAAVELVRLYPELVKQLILIEMYDYMPWYMQPLLVPRLNVFLYQLLFKSKAGSYFLNRILTNKFIREGGGMRYVEDGFQNTDTRVALNFLEAAKCFVDKVDREQYRMDIPTIYVEGGRSFKPIRAFRQTAIRCFRNLTIVSMPESLHTPIADQPERFSADVLHHLRRPLTE